MEIFALKVGVGPKGHKQYLLGLNVVLVVGKPKIMVSNQPFFKFVEW